MRIRILLLASSYILPLLGFCSCHHSQMQPLKPATQLPLFNLMKQFVALLAVLSLAPLTSALAQPQPGVPASVKLNGRRDIPYAEPADPRQKVDIYAPEGAKN